jgi:hypothetical protein
MPTKPKRPLLSPQERDEILTGLEKMRDRVKSDHPLTAEHVGNSRRMQLRMSPQDMQDLSVVRAFLSICTGRFVSMPLVTRLAMNLLVDECAAAIKDEAVKGRLHADLKALHVPNARMIPKATLPPETMH